MADKPEVGSNATVDLDNLKGRDCQAIVCGSSSQRCIGFKVGIPTPKMAAILRWQFAG